jgi:type IV pilus assembly protein PilE
MKIPIAFNFGACVSRESKSKGFTLVELMITVVVLSILVSIAIPSYSSYIQRSRRTDAKSALLNFATMEERFYSTLNKYSSTTTDFGYAAGPWPVTVGSGYYNVTVSNVNLPQIGQPATYTITAVAINSQAQDTQCATFQVFSNGTQLAFTSANVDNTATCWR